MNDTTGLRIQDSGAGKFRSAFGLLMFLIQVCTGFALYASMSHSSFPQLFTWVTPLLGGEAQVRGLHHLITWLFIVFTFIHVYLVAYHEYVEGHGVLTSIVGGWKVLPNKGHVAKAGDGAPRGPGGPSTGS